MREKELELYLHIPFCVKKCAYCDFLSGASTKVQREDYVKALCRQIESWSIEARRRGKEQESVVSIFLGGGTPSILEGEQIRKIMDAVRRTFALAPDCEITMEVNPGTADGRKLDAYRAAGINRFSIGLQSIQEEELKLLGRIHTYPEFLQVYEEARKAGCQNVNIDLMMALPGQTMESWKETLRKVVKLEPEHISAYSLIIEEGTLFYTRYGPGSQGEGVLPSEEEERNMYQFTKDYLASQGYERYEISNYAKPGFACRHNLGYWERRPYIGFGVGAASLWNQMRWKQTGDIAEYIFAWTKEEAEHHSKEGEETEQTEQMGGTYWQTAQEITHLTPEEEMEEFMFLGLRKTKGVSEETFLNTFQRPMEDVYARPLQELSSKELLVREAGRVYLTEKGTDLSNYVMAQFLL